MLDLLGDVLRRAKERGATAADAFLVEDRAFSAQVRLGRVDTVKHAREQHLSLRVFAGKSAAAASTSDFSRTSVERLVDEAVSLARITAPDELGGLPEAAALARDPRITNSEGGDFADRRARYAYAASHGFAGEYATSSFSLSASPVASENGRMQRDGWYHVTRKRANLDTPEEIGHIAGAVAGPSLYRGASFLLDKLGQQIAAPGVTIVDDGTMPGGLGSRPFDGEGLPVLRTVI